MNRRISLTHIVITLILAVIAVTSSRAVAGQDGLLKVHFFDIGQGDAIFIEAPNGNQMLIDGGPDGAILEKLGSTLPFYDHDLDIVAATHPHADHIAGLVRVLERYQAHHIVKTNYIYDSPEARAWDTAIKDENADIITASAGTIFDLGTGVIISVLNPSPDINPKDPNDSSIVFLLEYKDAKFILAGDIGAPGERRVLALPVTITADIIKIGHHGSSTSTSESFLRAITPQVAIISVASKNIYRLPNESTLTRLAKDDVTVYRTDVDGDVSIMTDGTTIAVTTEI